MLCVKRTCDRANVIKGYQLIPQSAEQNGGIVCPENDVTTATFEHTWRLFDDHLSILNLHQKKESSNSNSNKLMHACKRVGGVLIKSANSNSVGRI